MLQVERELEEKLYILVTSCKNLELFMKDHVFKLFISLLPI